METIICAGREFGVIETSQGPQGVYRLHGKNGPGKWAPHDGIVPCPGKSMPITQETRRFWKNPDFPGYGNKEIQSACIQLDSQPHTPRKGTFQEANLLLGEKGIELNQNLKIWEKLLASTDQKTVEERLREEKNHREGGIWIVKKLLEIGKKRTAGCRKPLIGKNLLAAAMIILASLPNSQAGLPEDIKAARIKIQNLSGEEIKGLLQSIPTEERLSLVKHLPKGVIPGFLPKEVLAQKLNLTPPEEIRKGFNKMTEEDFLNLAKKIGEKSIRKLIELLETKSPSQPTIASR